jgi:hypothetical protein
MKFSSLQLINQRDTWAATVFVLWIASAGLIINHAGNRTDVFLTVGIMPFSFSIAFGLTHFIRLS